MLSPQIKKVIELFSEFPTIGERTATRFALYLISLPKEKVEEICKDILALKTEIKICPLCFTSFQPKNIQETCKICKDKKREQTLCIVEKENDFWQIEKTKNYQGYYFILGGKLEFLNENALGKMRIQELTKRIESLKPREIILALNPTTDGILTMDYLRRFLKNAISKEIQITRLGRGIPLGGELEYADEETLKNSFEGRK